MFGILLTNLLKRDSIVAWLPCTNLVFSRLRMLFCYRYTTMIDKMAKSVWPVWHCLLCRWLSKVSEAPLKPAMTRYNTFTHTPVLLLLSSKARMSALVNLYVDTSFGVCMACLSMGFAYLTIVKSWISKEFLKRRQNYVPFYRFLRRIRKAWRTCFVFVVRFLQRSCFILNMYHFLSILFLLKDCE